MARVAMSPWKAPSPSSTTSERMLCLRSLCPASMTVASALMDTGSLVITSPTRTCTCGSMAGASMSHSPSTWAVSGGSAPWRAAT